MECNSSRVVCRRWRRGRSRGFRLASPRLYDFRFRLRFVRFIRVLTQWLVFFKKGSGAGAGSRGHGRRCAAAKTCGRRGLASEAHVDQKLRHARSNSFYAEAIADCLEFIKRSSVSVDDVSVSGGR